MDRKISKADLIAQIAKEVEGIDEKGVEQVVDGLLDAAEKGLVVPELRGLGELDPMVKRRVLSNACNNCCARSEELFKVSAEFLGAA